MLETNSKPKPKSDPANRAIARGRLALLLFILGSLSTGFAQQSTGLSSPRPAGSAPVPASALASSATEAISAPSGYKLSSGDQLAVEVFGEDDLRTNGRLNAEGNISLPLLGSVHLAGMTLSQAAARLTELYGRDYLVSPKVNAILIGYAKRRFTVLGEVNRPGSFEMPEGGVGGIDLLEAIAMAGGYTRIAAPERIIVRRHSPSGGEEVIKVNAKRLARSAGSREGGFLVEPGDAITVGESLF